MTISLIVILGIIMGLGIVAMFFGIYMLSIAYPSSGMKMSVFGLVLIIPAGMLFYIKTK